MNYSPGPMTKDDWANTQYLKLRTERDMQHNWGDLQLIDRSIIRTLDMWAARHKIAIIVTCGSGGKHVDGSYHYPTQDRLGIALDFMMPNVRRRELPDLLLKLLAFPFGGVGIYSEWKLAPNLPSIGGFHVDMRPSSIKATWLKGPEDGYIAQSMANLRKYFV